MGTSVHVQPVDWRGMVGKPLRSFPGVSAYQHDLGPYLEQSRCCIILWPSTVDTNERRLSRRLSSKLVHLLPSNFSLCS